VILIGLVSNIIATWLSTFTFYGIPVGAWLIPILIVLTLFSVYTILYPKETTKTAIYTNLMVNRFSGHMHLSRFSPFGVQYAVNFWRALEQDKSKYADELLDKLCTSDCDNLQFDFVEYVVFFILSGFEPLWASGKVEYYGYSTWPTQLGEETRLSPSTVYRFQQKEIEHDDFLNFKDIEFRNLRPMLENNKIATHFLGSTSLKFTFKPDNWLVFTPKGTQISVEHEKLTHIIHFSHRYFSINLYITKNSTGIGLPYGIRIKEENYNEALFFTADFRIDFEAIFSRWLILHWRRDDYYNWVRLLKEKLIANFALDKTGLIMKIE
jgi:hypothetical protein